MSAQTEDIAINTANGGVLAATVFYPPGEVRAAVMLAPATGMLRRFYRPFAEYLAAAGYAVITFDNQGLGGSLHGAVKDSQASLVSWGQNDMPAVLDELQQLFPGVSHHLIGHSAGGQLIGLMPNAGGLKSVFNVACSSGSVRNMAMPFRAKAAFFMRVFMPLSNAVFGCARNQWLGMGETLPRGVAREWSEWCNGSGYVKMALGKTVHTHLYDTLAMPSLWLHAPDDDIATEKNVKEMMAVFSAMPSERLLLQPADYGLRHIGHMKFFSRQSQQLWALAVEWLGKHA
ncbi:alpha/beta fold hydrolase [Uruburuella testudinis]|uniref:Alpha/beta fold hydrolase n=1 Tax=Uruburuella testudinis TaxID=1282863 RepID=A0ABY4DQG8_9NEIS|nr:alpha/beta fold hydrolase [Uruburuella testudinis]UOO81304.1 alpha/beta fold hydrolase [Uruburuella testudinis]